MVARDLSRELVDETAELIDDLAGVTKLLLGASSVAGCLRVASCSVAAGCLAVASWFAVVDGVKVLKPPPTLPAFSTEVVSSVSSTLVV